MKETRTINLNGLVYHIDYDAYQILRDYLHDIELRLPQEDRQEVMSDIEARIAELFQKMQFAKNTQVIDLEIVNSIKTQIGAPSEFGPNRRPKVKIDNSQNAGCSRVLSIVLNVVLAILALPVIFVVLIFLFSIIVSLIAVTATGTASVGALLPMFSAFADMLVDGGAIIIPLLIVAFAVIIITPIIMIVYTIVKYMRTRRGPKLRYWLITGLLWLASVIFMGVSLVRLYDSIDGAPQIIRSMVLDDMEVSDEGVVRSTLKLDAFHSVYLKGAAELHLMNAEVQSTTLCTNMLSTLGNGDDLKAEVRDSVLYIDVKNTLPIDEVMVDFTIATPYMRKITVYGASKIETIDGCILQQPALTLDLNGAAAADLQLMLQMLVVDAKGASSLELEGAVENATITIAGAGEVDAEDMVTQTMHINCAGASVAEVHVIRELWAQAAGASKISYKGSPKIKQKLAVGGSIIKRD